eukprot:4791574-Amphidinium_carterae.1
MWSAACYVLAFTLALGDFRINAPCCVRASASCSDVLHRPADPLGLPVLAMLCKTRLPLAAPSSIHLLCAIPTPLLLDWARQIDEKVLTTLCQILDLKQARTPHPLSFCQLSAKDVRSKQQQGGQWKVMFKGGWGSGIVRGIHRLEIHKEREDPEEMALVAAMEPVRRYSATNSGVPNGMACASSSPECLSQKGSPHNTSPVRL